MRVLVCGDRNWTDKDAIARELSKLPVTVVIEGEARGADSLARLVAEDMDVEVEPYPANWERHGRAAGPIRNRKMLEEGNPDIVLAFHHNLSKSKGTKDMVKRAEKAGVEVRCFDH